MPNSQQIEIKADWNDLLSEQFAADYFLELMQFVQEERQRNEVFPPASRVFAALNETSFAATRVVILGQDPYHGPGQAHGLCFSVPLDVPIPPSLANIFTELRNDVGVAPPPHGCLTSWAHQGVLLLNTTLTVRRGAPASHQARGWEVFTDHIISLLDARAEPVIFVLWGNQARRKKALLECPQHHVLESPHPSPLSAHRGFFGSKPFSRINETLIQHGSNAICWDLM